MTWACAFWALVGFCAGVVLVSGALSGAGLKADKKNADLQKDLHAAQIAAAHYEQSNNISGEE